MKNKIESFEKMLQNTLNPKESPLGLFGGLMGICIYFFYKSRKENNLVYKEKAEQLLDYIFFNVKNIENIDVKTGLAGIGLGIDHLIKKGYVDGEVNTVLHAIDDKIFRNLSFSKYYETLDLITLHHLLYYLYIRVKQQKDKSFEQECFQELVIHVVEVIYTKLNQQHFSQEVSSVYLTDYEMPLFLFLMSKIYLLGFYKTRIQKILEEISARLFSTIPLLHVNRLYLLWGMHAVYQQINEIENWGNALTFLQKQIEVKKIFNEELKDKNIFFENGLLSVYMLLTQLKNCFEEEDIEEMCKTKILQSETWDLLKKEEKYFDTHKGLFSGFCGVAIFLSYLDNKN